LPHRRPDHALSVLRLDDKPLPIIGSVERVDQLGDDGTAGGFGVVLNAVIQRLNVDTGRETEVVFEVGTALERRATTVIDGCIEVRSGREHTRRTSGRTAPDNDDITVERRPRSVPHCYHIHNAPFSVRDTDSRCDGSAVSIDSFNILFRPA